MSILNAAESKINRLLQKIEYKPESSFQAFQVVKSNQIGINLNTRGPDSRNPKMIQKFKTSHYHDPYVVSDMHDDVLVDLFWNQIVFWEKHEAAEWFKVNGVLIRDPHRGEK